MDTAENATPSGVQTITPDAIDEMIASFDAHHDAEPAAAVQNLDEPADAGDEPQRTEPAPEPVVEADPIVEAVPEVATEAEPPADEEPEAREDYRPPEVPVEDPAWTVLKEACPLWGVGSLHKVTDDLAKAMGLRRRSRGDELVVDLLAWAPIYRTASAAKKGASVIERSGYKRTRLCLAVQMLEAVARNSGVIPTAWLGLGPDGVADLLRVKPTPKEKVTPTPKPKPPKIDPPAWAEGTKKVIAVLDDREVRDALRADEKSAKAFASGLATAAIRAICLLEPKAAKRALRQLAKEADARRAFAVPTFETKPKKGEADAPEGGSVIDLFAGSDDDDEAAS